MLHATLYFQTKKGNITLDLLFFCLHHAIYSCQLTRISRLVCDRIEISEKILVDSPNLWFNFWITHLGTRSPIFTLYFRWIPFVILHPSNLSSFPRAHKILIYCSFSSFGRFLLSILGNAKWYVVRYGWKSIESVWAEWMSWGDCGMWKDRMACDLFHRMLSKREGEPWSKRLNRTPSLVTKYVCHIYIEREREITTTITWQRSHYIFLLIILENVSKEEN